MQDEGYTTIQVGGPRAKRRGVALVDHADAEAVSAYSWSMHRQGYARRYTLRGEGKRRQVYMHREILGLGLGDPDVDHINGNALDNRQENLRTCTNAQNHQNRRERPHRGASWHARDERWVAQAEVGTEMGRKNHWLGYYDTQEEAAAVAAAFRRQHMPYSRDAREGT
jgi:hypothetical protein